MVAKAGFFGRFSFAHGHLFATFPPYRIASFVFPPALLLALLGFWAAPLKYVIPKPVGTNGAAGSANAGSNSGAGGQSLSGDYLTCNSAITDMPMPAAQAALTACQRVQNNTASGTGTLSPADIAGDEATAEQAVHDYTDALQDIEKSLAAAPTASRYDVAAIINNNMMNFPAAMQDANSALSINPHDVGALYEKAGAELGENNPQAALADTQTALQIAPNFFFANKLRGQAEAEVRDFNNAVGDESVFLQQRPQAPDALYWRGYAEAHLAGQEAQARSDLQASLNLYPNDADAYLQLAYLAFRAKDYDAVISYAGEALNLTPNNPAALTVRSGAEIDQKQFSAALDDAQAALNQKPIPPIEAAALENLGVANEGLGNYPAAADAFQRALQVSPDNPVLQSLLHDVQQGTGSKK